MVRSQVIVTINLHSSILLCPVEFNRGCRPLVLVCMVAIPQVLIFKLAFTPLHALVYAGYFGSCIYRYAYRHRVKNDTVDYNLILKT